MKYILIIGNSVEGLVHVGPFDSEAEAIAAGGKIIEHDWLVVELTAYDEDNLPLFKRDFERMKWKR